MPLGRPICRNVIRAPQWRIETLVPAAIVAMLVQILETQEQIES